jgi:hypothetical protein
LSVHYHDNNVTRLEIKGVWVAATLPSSNRRKRGGRAQARGGGVFDAEGQRVAQRAPHHAGDRAGTTAMGSSGRSHVRKQRELRKREVVVDSVAESRDGPQCQKGPMVPKSIDHR